MKKRILTVLAILAVFGYMIFIGRSSYMFGWLAEQNFLYVWALIAIMVVAKQDVCAIWSTVGAVFAVFPAEIVDWLVRRKGNNSGADLIGVITWIAVTVIFLALGVFMQYRKWKKEHPKKENPAEQPKEKPVTAASEK